MPAWQNYFCFARRACDTPFDDLHRSVDERQNALDTYQPKAMLCTPVHHDA